MYETLTHTHTNTQTHTQIHTHLLQLQLQWLTRPVSTLKLKCALVWRLSLFTCLLSLSLSLALCLFLFSCLPRYPHTHLSQHNLGSKFVTLCGSFHYQKSSWLTSRNSRFNAEFQAKNSLQIFSQKKVTCQIFTKDFSLHEKCFNQLADMAHNTLPVGNN